MKPVWFVSECNSDSIGVLSEVPTQRNTIVLGLLVSAVVAIPMSRDYLSVEQPSRMIQINIFAYTALLVAGLTGLGLTRLTASEVGLRTTPRFERLLGCLLLGGVFFIPAALIPTVLRVPSHLLLLVAGIVVEEFLCRGVIQGLASRVVGPGSAVVLSALVFSAMHAVRYPLPVLLVGLSAGLLLAVWKQRFGDLLAPIVGHLCADLLASSSL